MRRAEDAAAGRIRTGMLLPALAVLSTVLWTGAEELPENEFQASFNGYFDNFHVNILYPTFSLTKRISPTTSLTGRYLVDAITAASMRSRYEIDGITSATTRQGVDAVTSASARAGREDQPAFDEVRHEITAGLTKLVGEGSVSANALYSTEHDYTSKTLAGQLTVPFALKNTVLQAGAVRSWDKVFPDTRTWKRNKNVLTFSGGLTQVLGKRAILQINGSYSKSTGYLSDPYQPVPILSGDSYRYHETVLPDLRIRNAVGARVNVQLNALSSLQLGYRYYWDDWKIDSDTYNVFYQRYVSDRAFTLGLGFRHYVQTRAGFFKAEYTAVEKYMTVDSKLNSCFSDEIEFNLDIDGSRLKYDSFMGFLYSDRTRYFLKLNFYRRHNPIPDWFSGYRDLYAYIVSIGFRYRL